mmetsp:Transcript_2108/g.8229  ORF Transcript_2108/g.8229 Transcript_2108/m.8229 type:complete len:244 (-) Transcript_2108:813-1544(-)
MEGRGIGVAVEHDAQENAVILLDPAGICHELHLGGVGVRHVPAPALARAQVPLREADGAEGASLRRLLIEVVLVAVELRRVDHAIRMAVQLLVDLRHLKVVLAILVCEQDLCLNAAVCFQAVPHHFRAWPLLPSGRILNVLEEPPVHPAQGGFVVRIVPSEVDQDVVALLPRVQDVCVDEARVLECAHSTRLPIHDLEEGGVAVCLQASLAQGRTFHHVRNAQVERIGDKHNEIRSRSQRVHV